MARSAAFFDLDRTVIEGPSGPAFGEALREHGLLDNAPHPLEKLPFGIYEIMGETASSMALVRQATRLTEGWAEDLVAAAGASAAARLMGRVAPYLRAELLANRRAGRALVMATTSADELARPLAAALGFDDVIATRYNRNEGLLDGTISGELLWGEAKSAAVGVWSESNGVDLGSSTAYTDSYFDLPLLDAVGAPVAVNPDPRLRAMAVVRGWPIVSLSAPGPEHRAGRPVARVRGQSIYDHESATGTAGKDHTP